MCGISGIINQSTREVSHQDIETMNNLISHRGPDGEGYFYKDNFAFGHRRLAILDLSSDGHQPMNFLDKYTITYNGEIYNYLEIKEILSMNGYIFNTHSDTEVILASYDKWGKDCVKQFNGMWAFAIYDKGKNIIFCSRDRFGIKPFYYTNIDNKFIFGSEIKQLLEFYEDRFVNKEVLMSYLVFSLEEYSNETFFENILKLPQSHNLIYELSTHTYTIEKYFNISIDNQLKDIDENLAIEIYKKSFYNSIKLRLRSDVKVGTCLSGGLDSSAIASIAGNIYREKTNQKFTAIHAKSIEKSTDESHYAIDVSNHSGLDLKIVEPTNDDFIENIDEVIFAQEEPFGGPSIFMQYFVMKKAKMENCKVMLDGQGGDETLLGYNRYYILYLKHSKFINLLKDIKDIKNKSSQSLLKIAYYYFGMTFTKLRIFLHKKEYKFLNEEYMKYLNNEIILKITNSSKDDKELQILEIMQTNVPMLLKYEDKNSMRNSIETRLPFLDYLCVNTAISLPISIKLKSGWSKYILRKVISNILPKNIIWRKQKFGFEAPTSIWLEKFRDEMDKSINESIIISKITINLDLKNINDRQKWKLFNIAKWESIYNVKIK
ncbi:MAG: asparagine synthase (glutamine-hydrolyzing) [Sulfurovum sp.]